MTVNLIALAWPNVRNKRGKIRLNIFGNIFHSGGTEAWISPPHFQSTMAKSVSE